LALFILVSQKAISARKKRQNLFKSSLDKVGNGLLSRYKENYKCTTEAPLR